MLNPVDWFPSGVWLVIFLVAAVVAFIAVVITKDDP